VPLVTHDSYFSVWSPADRLTDAGTTHWTGKTHPLRSLLRVDGQAYRVMGTEPAALPALPQIEVRVLPTRTLYRFGNSQVVLALTFLTPALPSDLEALARPVTYLDWEVGSADSQPHSVQVYFECGAELAVNLPQQKVVWERPAVAGLKTLKLCSKDQRILAKKGDDLRIDWGCLYLAATEDQHPRMAIARGPEARKLFAENGGLPSRDDASCPRAVRDDAPVLAVSFDFGRVGQQAASRRLMLAYDDLYSIKYFRSRLRPYWRRGAAEATDLLQAAARDYPALAQRCRKFDEDLMADLTRVGGEHYALLCALAYRQTFAGNKIAADAKGMPLLFPKENFSNGCISTVDVLFPQAPFFAHLQPCADQGHAGADPRLRLVTAMALWLRAA
jgi:hypothetical protein